MRGDASEGNGNLGERRRLWRRNDVGDDTRSVLERDEAVFLRQSLSTPCLSAVRRAEGIWIEDMDGRRIMDFHGNSAHHVGYGHPRVKEAIYRQIEDLPFAPRRFTCEAAVALAERLVALAPAGFSKVLFAPGGSEAIKIAHYVCGLSDYTPDGLPVFGSLEAVEGLIAVAGCGAGIAISGGVGLAAAELAAGDEASLDLSAFKPERFGAVDPFDPAFRSRCSAARAQKGRD